MSATDEPQTEEEWREWFDTLVERLANSEHVHTRDSELVIQEGGPHTQRPRWRLVLRHPGTHESHIGPGFNEHEAFEAFIRGLEMSPRIGEKSEWGN